MTTTAGPISNVVLYHYPLSRSTRVLFLINELGLQQNVEVKTVKLMLGEGHSEEFLKMNPFHAVPVLTFTVNATGEKRVMLESCAIVRFLASTFKDVVGPNLIPLDGAPLADVSEFEQWFALFSVTMDMILWQIRVINDFRGRQKTEEDLLQFFTSKWNNEIVPQLDSHFSKPNQQFVSTNLGFTILDIMLTQTLNWSHKYVSQKLLHRPSADVMAYVKRMSSRPAWKATTKDGHLFEKDSKM